MTTIAVSGAVSNHRVLLRAAVFVSALVLLFAGLASALAVRASHQTVNGVHEVPAATTPQPR
jgi:hypothetical protein